MEDGVEEEKCLQALKPLTPAPLRRRLSSFIHVYGGVKALPPELLSLPRASQDLLLLLLSSPSSATPAPLRLNPSPPRRTPSLHSQILLQQLRGRRRWHRRGCPGRRSSSSSSPFRAHPRTFFSSSFPPRPLRPPRPSVSILLPLAAPPLSTLRFSSSSSAAVVDGTAAAAPAAAHPWPEWDLFLDTLRSKGHFPVPSSAAATADDTEDAADSTSDRASSVELTHTKIACLKFARERFDILGSLPREDIQAVVECGCPNLHRKAVNSAKRLRAFLGLDEADVCGNCGLKGSCDKAYVVKEDGAARTVDVVRILLTYAVDPASLSRTPSPHVNMQVQESARKLLSELIRLGDTTIDPTLLKPTVESPSKKEPSIKANSKKEFSQTSEMKKGDWLCANCNFLNFARNVRCLECKADGPKRVNFTDAEMKPGDWNCPECQYMNFARNKKCLRCQGLRPNKELNPGEWECPRCDYLNFRRNKVCLKCSCDRPNVESSQFEDHAWRKPKASNMNSSFKFGDDEDEGSDRDDDLPIREGQSRFVASIEKRLTSVKKVWGRLMRP